MNYVVFENPGEIDARSIKSFGVSVKETENPIGFFGTGLKYSIAILVRSGHSVEIQSGKEVFTFAKKETSIRGKAFDFITMNDDEMPFTTELGKNWEVWQAYRELQCNMMDEGGKAWDNRAKPQPESGVTRVIVQGDAFEAVYRDRGSIILNLPETALLVRTPQMEVYNKSSDYMYYRGIRIYKPGKCMFTYNLLEATELTEDRTIKYESRITDKIPRTLSRIKDKSVIRDILTCDDNWFEYKLSFDGLIYWTECVSEEFMEYVEQAYKTNNHRVNRTAVDFYKSVLKKQPSKFYEPEEMTTVEKAQLEKCRSVLRKLFSDFDDYEILVVKSLGQVTMALADDSTNTMVVSKNAFQLGTKFLMSTLIEEYAHLRTGYRDHTRELQTWLFDQLCTMIENHVLREPI